jgi:hypothetical protein
MLRASEVIRAGLWGGNGADVVRLDYDLRTRRRISLRGVNGLAFLLDLATASGYRMDASSPWKRQQNVCWRSPAGMSVRWLVSPGTSAIAILPPKSGSVRSIFAMIT